MRDVAIATVVRVNPRMKTPELDRCPQCGSTNIELRTDGGYLCSRCYYVTKPSVNSSLLQSYSHSIFSIERSTTPSEDLVFGGRLAGLGGLLMLVGIAIAVGPFTVPSGLERFLDPRAPSELARVGGLTVVGVLGLIGLLSGYTMSRGDPKAWLAALPVGLLALLLGIIGPGALLGAIGGVFAAVGGFIGRHGED